MKWGVENRRAYQAEEEEVDAAQYVQETKWLEYKYWEEHIY